MRARRTAAWLVAGASALAAAAPAQAQMYQLYLDCKGKIMAGNKSRPADVHLALRDNNMSALVQRSNVLPVGEHMRYTASDTHYAFVYRTPQPGTVVYTNWLGNPIFVWHPDFRRLIETRLSVDRQTGALEGELLDRDERFLGQFQMQCEPRKDGEGPAPKF